MILRLDDIEFNQKYISGLDKFSISVIKAQSGIVTKSFTNEIEFFGDAYNYIKTKLIDDINGWSKKINVKIYDTCCKDGSNWQLVYEGAIMGDGADYCINECKITANIIEDSAKSNAYDRLNSHLVWEDRDGKKFYENYTTIPKIYYCNWSTPDWMIGFLLSFTYCLDGFLLSLYALVPIIASTSSMVFVICNIVKALTGKNIDCKKYRPDNAIKSIKDAIQNLRNSLQPCGRYHPSPFVRDYLDNVCKLSGLTFKSTIFSPGSDYYNSTYFYAPTVKGQIFSKSTNILTDNYPLKTGISLINDLMSIFNADWNIVGNQLQFERKDHFVYNEIVANAGELNTSGRLINICYSWNNNSKFVGAMFNYTDDGLDCVSIEGKRKRYAEIVNWNINNNPAQKGFKDISFPFAPVRCLGDKISSSGFELATQNFLVALLSRWKGSVLLEREITSVPKLIIWNEGLIGVPYFFDVPNDILDSFPTSTLTGNSSEKHPKRVYNYAYWINSSLNNISGYKNIYEFQRIDNPEENNNIIYRYDFTMEYVMDCQDRKLINDNDIFGKKVLLLKNNSQTDGRIEEITFNFGTKTITIKGSTT
jgi:hypothetical protein